MCGRYTVHKPKAVIQAFQVQTPAAGLFAARYNVAPTDHTSVSEICSITGARLIPGPVRLLKAGADLSFRLRLSPFSGHWVTPGDPLLDSGLLQATTDWRPSMNSAAALRKYLATRDNQGATR